MVEKNMNFIISTIFFIYLSTQVNSQCVQTSPCSCLLPDGTGYNFSNLAKQGPLNASNPSGERQFWFQPCKDVKLSDTSINGTDDCSKPVSLCVWNKISSKYPQNGGTVSESKLELTNGKNLLLVFKHNTNTTQINLVCCLDCTSHVLSIDSLPSDSEAILILVSQDVCKYQKEGISAGSVFFILLLVFAGVYFIGGALALKFLRGATGWEMLPNHRFWCALGNQIKIGFLFLCSGCKEDSYERI